MRNYIFPEKTILGELSPIETYMYFDFPRFFSAYNQKKEIFVAVNIDYLDTDGEDGEIWLFSRMPLERLREFQTGKISFHDIFAKTPKGHLFEAITHFSSSPDMARMTTIEEAADGFPDPGVTLDSEYKWSTVPWEVNA